jgi:hypothetical protein
MCVFYRQRKVMLWEEGMDGKGTTTYTSCAAQTAHTPQLNKASRSGSQHDAWYLAGRPITVQTHGWNGFCTACWLLPVSVSEWLPRRRDSETLGRTRFALRSHHSHRFDTGVLVSNLLGHTTRLCSSPSPALR